MILHRGTTFLAAKEPGYVPAGGQEGLYFEDTRFLSRHELRVDGRRPLLLTSRALHPTEAMIFLTNPPCAGAPGGTLGIVRHIYLHEGLHEDIDVENFGDQEARITLELASDADFAHIFRVKQAVESD